MNEKTEDRLDRILLLALKEVRKRRDDPTDGICWSVERWQGRQPEYRDERLCSVRIHYLSQAWPKYSGNPNFPVPSPIEGQTPVEAFDAAVHVRGRMWSKKKPYGMMRWELLEFLIETLEKRFAEAP